MELNLFKFYRPGILVSFILVFGSIFNELIKFIGNLLIQNFDLSIYQFPTTSFLIGGLIVLISKYFWCIWPFKFMFWVPEIQGRYEGQIFYVHPVTKISESKNCVVEINQNGMLLKVNCFFIDVANDQKSPSRSIVETIIKESDGSFKIVFTYTNEGIPSLFQEHSGTNILRFIKNEHGQFLKGIYYTNREPQTKGKMEVKLVSKSLKYDY